MTIGDWIKEFRHQVLSKKIWITPAAFRYILNPKGAESKEDYINVVRKFLLTGGLQEELASFNHAVAPNEAPKEVDEVVSEVVKESAAEETDGGESEEVDSE